MLLAVDVGNTNVVIGVWDKSEWKHLWRLKTTSDNALYYYEVEIKNLFLENGFDAGHITQAVYSSVVPELNDDLLYLLSNIFGFETAVLGPDLYKKLPLDVKNPQEIGSDLVANALAGFELSQDITTIVDFGTALTFTTLDKSGDIIGVSILPGLKTAINALFNKTAQLPLVPLEKPQSVLGFDTTTAIQTGILYGYTGLTQHMLQCIKKEVGTHLKVIATGGLSFSLQNNEELKNQFDIIDPMLTLNGLKIAASYS